MLAKARKRAKELGIEGKISLSDRPNKKLKIITPSGKTVHFGLKGSQTFLEGATKEKRKSYQARHSKIKLKDGRLAYKVKYTPSYLSWWILW